MTTNITGRRRRRASKPKVEGSNTKSAVFALGAVVAFAVVLLLTLLFAIWALTKFGGTTTTTVVGATTTTGTTAAPPEVMLAPVLLVAVVILILAMGALTIVFRRLRLQNPNAAMGMPEGSIRAVIALMLIVLFFILSIFLLGQLGQEGQTQSQSIGGLTVAQVDSIPIDRLISKTRDGGTDAAPTYTIVQLLPTNSALESSSNQLLTTISTLVVAVAAFYFGSSSVTAAYKAANRPEADPPSITSLTPPYGPEGTSVVIAGHGFTGATGVTFGETAATSKTVNSDIQITATSPPGSGTVDVLVTTPAGTSEANPQDEFSYPPAITDVNPTTGAAGQSVDITGSGFTGATKVAFDDLQAEFTPDSDTHLIATSPAGQGTANITVTTPAGTSAKGTKTTFTYAPTTQVKTSPPTVTSLSPPTGAAAGGETVDINGTGFTDATQITFGTAPATPTTPITDTKITVTSPPGTGTVDVTVTTPAGTSTKDPNSTFTYT